MNERCHLILVNGENKTSGIQYCKYNPNTKKYDVTFKNGKTYPYNYNSIEWIKKSGGFESEPCSSFSW